jgi:hypothetical protein
MSVGQEPPHTIFLTQRTAPVNGLPFGPLALRPFTDNGLSKKKRTHCATSRPHDRNLKEKGVAMTNPIHNDNGLSNIHPADALADVRAEIKALKVKEDHLRAKIISKGEDLVGEFHEASVGKRSSIKLDEKKLKAVLGNLTPYQTEKVQTCVYLKLRRNG